MNYRFILIIVLLNGCTFSPKTIKSRFFADLDIYSLKGINEVAPNEYPNIQIADSQNSRMLTYHIDDSNFIQRNYTKVGESWVLNFFEKDDTTNIYTTRIVYPKGLVEFSYTDTSNYLIYDVGVLIRDTMKYYWPKNNYKRKLNLEDIKSIIAHDSLKIKFWFDTTGKNIQVNKLFYPQIDKSDTPIITCYPKNNQSFFWWYETQYYQSSIPCNGNVSQ